MKTRAERAMRQAISLGVECEWQTIDLALRKIAGRRAALDAEEARWLREAERCEIWRELGMVSALDYFERVLGYSPRAAQDRLRVARALGELPVLTNALAEGALSYSAKGRGDEASGAPACRAPGSRWSAVRTRTQAKDALVGLGWPSKIAAAAVASAMEALGEDTALEPLVFEALRRCPKAS